MTAIRDSPILYENINTVLRVKVGRIGYQECIAGAWGVIKVVNQCGWRPKRVDYRVV
nr:hypothetical protein [Rubripirellula obstinata]